MSNKKDEAISVMQEYFPNGGRDWDAICELYDAIKQGKIPNIVVADEKDKHAGFAADKHSTNHAGEHYWYKEIEGGFTECCEYGAECEKHKAIRGKE